MKKIFYGVLFLILCMPIAVFADDIYTDGTNNYATFAEAINGCTTCNIKLLADVNKNEIEIPAGKTVNLDLNGKTVSYDAITCTSCADIVNSGTLNVSNGTLADSKDGSYTANKYGILNGIGATATVKNVTFSFTGAVNSAAVINSGKITIDNSKYLVGDKNVHGFINTKDGEMIINSGEYTSKTNLSLIENYVGKLTINGGKFSVLGDHDSASLIQNNGELTINNGEFNTDIANILKVNEGAKVNIKNGNFTSTSGHFIFYCSFGGVSVQSYEIPNTGQFYVIVDNANVSVNSGIICTSLSRIPGNFRFNGGTYKTKGGLFDYRSAYVELLGGTYTSENGDFGALLSDETFIIGKDDGTINADAPVLTFKEFTTANGKLNFYDGTIYMNQKFTGGSGRYTINTPQNTTVKYLDGAPVKTYKVVLDNPSNGGGTGGTGSGATGGNNNSGNITPASDTDPIENPNTGMFIGIGAILIGGITLLTLCLKKKFYRI